MREFNSSIPAMVTLDPGYSDTKIITRLAPSRLELLLMSPHVVEVSREGLDLYKASRITKPEPENEAWVEYNGRYYAVGSLARKYFKAKLVLDDLKYELGIAKVLAACGVIAIKEGLPDKFELALAVPLPFAEWNDRLKFEREVRKALADFAFCDKPMSLKLKVFICFPEGGGHVQIRGERIGAAFAQSKIAALMFGFRDLSTVLFDLGVISGETERLGSTKLIELVQNRTSGHNSEERARKLLESIHQAGKEIKVKNFKHLALSRNPEYRAEELEQLVEAIKAARSEYWGMVSRFLLNSIPADVDEIIVGGGTSDYLRPELQSFFAGHFGQASLSWSAELEEDVRVAFNLSSQKKGLCVRLSDAFGLSRFMQQQVCPKVISAK